jgi:MFS family permease
MLRRLLIVASVVVFVDIAFFAAITPLLPGYTDEFGLGKDAAGLLTASYAIGTLLASLPAGVFAARVGPRPAMLGGLYLLGAASIAFGVGDSIVVLDLARFCQGLGSALTWAGAITWLMISAPEGRRGELIGTALGAAVAGAFLGPVIGGIAHGIGTEVVFSSVAILTAALAWATLSLPAPQGADEAPFADALRAMRMPLVLVAALLVAIPSLMSGLLSVLMPLRIDELGGTAAVIAGGYAVGAAIETVMAPLVGRLSDTRGRNAPMALGFLISVLAGLILPLADSVAVVLGTMLIFSVGAGFAFAPAMARLSDSAETIGLHQGYAAGLLNMAWAAGQIAGSAGGGSAAEAWGDAVPCIIAAALLLGMMPLLRSRS